jgi:SPP1 gp7 family putative phage head morphogenesis protein
MTDAEILNGVGFGKGNMSYWETVYRTNTGAIQNAGRAMCFGEVPPIALELVGVQDARQTDICRSLTEAPFIRKYDDPIWKDLWPPFHFNCRTTVRGIYDPTELDGYGGPEMAYRRGDFAAPEKGFGGYPLDKESYWRLTPEMVDRARHYGIDGEIAKAAVRLGMESYAMELVKGYKEIYASPSGGYAKKALNAAQSGREIGLAKKAADDGHQIYLLPENKSTPNPDIIFDGEVGELKQPVSEKPGRIDEDIRDSGHKGATVTVMEVRDDVPKNVIEATIRKRMNNSIVEKALVYWKGGSFWVLKK